MSKSILIVEGETKLRKLYQEGLQAVGYRVESAASGSKALEKLHQHPADVIVMDLVLPDGTGFEHLYNFLQVSEESKVVINTSHPEFKADFHSWSADAYLSKSSDITELRNTINGILHQN